MNLSVIIIIPQGQEHALSVKRAVQSAQFADEILVIQQKFSVLDFAECRNNAMQQARGEWVMFLDSDEEITPALAKEIKRLVAPKESSFVSEASSLAPTKSNPSGFGRTSEFFQRKNSGSSEKFGNPTGFYVKRRDRFLGKWLQHGETAHVKLLRLARKDAGKWVRPVHEVWRVEGVVGTLREPILHYSHQTVDEMLEKLDWYSNLESEYRKSVTQKMYYNQSGRNDYNTFLIISLMLFPIGKFIQNYFFRLGFFDGMQGFIHAAMMSFHSFSVRAKMLSRIDESENQRITRISE